MINPMKKNMIFWISALLMLACPAFASNPQPAMPNDAQAVEQLLKMKTDAVLAVIQNKDMAESVKKDQIMAIIEPIIDFRLMSKLTLGKANWGKFSEAQQAEFVELFVERLKRSYLDKTSAYNGEKVAYKPATQKGNKVNAPLDILTTQKPIELLYKFYKSDEGWKAYDLEINGVSLIKSYQAQFTEILNTGTPRDLLAELKKPVVETSSPGVPPSK
ncbi:MAG: ABC transporter substrate-binding protein [Desulfobacteraceae bacterium]|nr:MAG: ABC transporter substrate-binding protein [Desulfobacteraceae bacterium]